MYVCLWKSHEQLAHNQLAHNHNNIYSKNSQNDLVRCFSVSGLVYKSSQAPSTRLQCAEQLASLDYQEIQH